MSKQLQVALILCTVMSLLKHDGQVYAAGDRVELTEDQAAPLLANGTVQLVDAAADKAAADKAAADKAAADKAAADKAAAAGGDGKKDA
jgi:membrane protein involved in colicin uptake